MKVHRDAVRKAVDLTAFLPAKLMIGSECKRLVPWHSQPQRYREDYQCRSHSGFKSAHVRRFKVSHGTDTAKSAAERHQDPR